MELTRKTTILMTADQHDKLRAEAARRGKSLGRLIREACEQLYLQPQTSDRVDAVDAMGQLDLPVDDVARIKGEYIARDKGLPL